MGVGGVVRFGFGGWVGDVYVMCGVQVFDSSSCGCACGVWLAGK